jgi:hypothetical protein
MFSKALWLASLGVCESYCGSLNQFYHSLVFLFYRFNIIGNIFD